MKKILMLILVILVVSLFISNNDEKSAEELKIGVILPLTGPVSLFGESIKNGIELAKEDLFHEKIPTA